MASIIKYILFVIFISFFASTAYSEGLSSLIQVGKSQDGMQKVLKEETQAFEKVKKAVKDGDIEAGQSKDTIVKKYGKPIIILTESNSTEKWVYKPGHASYFDNTKIYLFFDDEGILNNIEILEKEG